MMIQFHQLHVYRRAYSHPARGPCGRAGLAASLLRWVWGARSLGRLRYSFRYAMPSSVRYQ